MTVLKATQNNILKAAQTVKKGGTVVYPTETVYGLGCDPLNRQAVKRVLEVKGNRNKPFPVLAANLADANKIAVVSVEGKKLATKFWPGPLTIIFPRKAVLSDVVTFGLDSVGVRIPNNDVALSLIRLSGGLLIGSSANRSGEKSPRSVQEMSEELKNMVDIVLDGGHTLQGTPSTVVDLSSDTPKILREGPINLKQILNTLALSD